MITVKEFQQFIEKNIPLSKNMQAEFLEISSARAVLNVPLKPNLNHKGTAFGGSQFAACALACYGLVWALVEESKVSTDNIVIAESSIRYQKPVATDFTIIVEFTQAESAIQKWKDTGKLKINLKAQVYSTGQIHTEMNGLFVVRPNIVV